MNLEDHAFNAAPPGQHERVSCVTLSMAEAAIKAADELAHRRGFEEGYKHSDHESAIKAAVAALRVDAELWRAVSASTMELWDGVEMRDAVTAWENEYRARLARGVTTDAEVKAHHAAIDQARGDGNG